MASKHVYQAISRLAGRSLGGPPWSILHWWLDTQNGIISYFLSGPCAHTHTDLLYAGLATEACLALISGREPGNQEQARGQCCWGRAGQPEGNREPISARAVEHTGGTGASPLLAVGGKTKEGVSPIKHRTCVCGGLWMCIIVQSFLQLQQLASTPLLLKHKGA